MHSVTNDHGSFKNHSVTREAGRAPQTQPIPEEQVEEPVIEFVQPTSEQAQHERHAQISAWFKHRANLLEASSDQVGQEGDAIHERKYGENKAFRPIIEVVSQIGNEVFFQLGKIMIGIGLLGLGVNVDPNALVGINVGVTAGEQIHIGSGYGWEKRQLSLMKTKLKVINQQIKEIKEPNDPRLPIFNAQKQQLKAQIANQKAVLLNQGYALVQGGFLAAFGSVVTLLQLAPATNQAAQFSAGGGGLILGVVGFGLGAKALYDTVGAYEATNQQLGDLGRIHSPGFTSENVKNTVDLIDLAAMDYTANYQRNKVKVGIFQSAFATCSSAAGVGAGIVGILALANVAGIGVAAAVSGIGMPILGAVGALLTGAIYLVRNRRTISRGINGLFGPSDKAIQERVNLKKNLVVREWYAKTNLKNAVKEMEKLSFERSALLGGTGMSETSEKIKNLDKQMLEKAGEIEEYREKLDETRYKKAMQSARDKTPTIKMTKDAAIVANERALDSVGEEIAEVERKMALLENPDENEIKRAFAELKADKISEMEAHLKEVKRVKERIRPLDFVLNQLLSRKLSEWSGILRGGYAILSNLGSPLNEKELIERLNVEWTAHLKKIDESLDDLSPAQLEEREQLEKRREKIESYLMDPEMGLEAELDRLNAIETMLSGKIETLKNADATRIDILKQEYVSQKEKLIQEQTQISAKLEELRPAKKSDTEIELQELVQEEKPEVVYDEKMMVVDALAQNIEKLNAEELENLVSNCNNRNIKFDDWDKAEPLEQQKRYIKTQILGTIAAGQVSRA